MSKKQLEVVFWLTALLLAPVSFLLAFAYAGPEPFYEYHRADAVAFIGIASALVALWIVWSLGIIGLVIAGTFSRWWFAGLLVAAICVNYLTLCPEGYFFDLEHFMLSVKQQERIGVPILTE